MNRILTFSFLIVTLAAGAAETTTNPPPEIAVTPIVNYVHVKGNAGQFRQDYWMKDGWTGGIDQFTLDQQLGKDTTLHLDGRGLFNAEDYRLRLELTKTDLGYIRAGYTEYQRYSAWPNMPGLVAPDLKLREGNIFFEAGLTLPNLPIVTIGYERQFRDGNKSLLEWGPVTTPAGIKNTYPSYLAVDESVDIFKLGLSHHFGKVDFGDEFRLERYRNGNTTYDQDFVTTTQQVTVQENTHYDVLQNVFHMDCHVNDKVYWSAGYLFSRLNGDAGLNLTTVPFVGVTSKDWFTSAVNLDSDSHVVNGNVMLGPFQKLTLYGGLQAERTVSSSDANATLLELVFPGVPYSPTARMNTRTEKESLDETVGARFAGIPFTTLYADAKWTEQQYHHDEFETIAAVPADLLTRDADVFRQQYTVGFNSSPLRRVTISAHYRHIENENTYENIPGPAQPDGYPGFLNDYNLTTDELVAKLNLRAHAKLNLSFQYRLAATDIRVFNRSALGGLVPAGSVDASAYHSATYSATATYTPFARLYLTGSVSFQDTRTLAAVNYVPAVLPYRGNVFSVFGALGYAIDDKTDATIDYMYSQSSNFKNNLAAGLPLGLDDNRHALTVGLSRQIKSNIVARIRYGYYEYNETATGGLFNYRANLASASCTVRF